MKQHRIFCFVVLKNKENATEQDLKNWLKPRIARFEMPKHIIFIDKMKYTSLRKIDKKALFTAQLNDQLFSFAELGFQEVETYKLLTTLLEKEGFTIEKGLSGIPTAWGARWGSGKPVIAVGSDIDCIPKASQKPGVAYHDPIVEGAPGHGEGHNAPKVEQPILNRRAAEGDTIWRIQCPCGFGCRTVGIFNRLRFV